MSFRPPAPTGPRTASQRPSAPPKAKVSLDSFKRSSAPPVRALQAVPSAPPSVPPPIPSAAKTRRDATPSGPRAVSKIPSPPPLPREAVIQMATTELPLEEIDYDQAYNYDVAVLEARLKRKSVVPPKLVEIATDVRASLAPEGREEAKKELRDMRRVSMRGLAVLFRRAATLLDAYA